MKHPVALFVKVLFTPHHETLSLQRAVEQWYGVTYRRSKSYHRLFALAGFSYQRPGKVYKSRSAAKVADFEEQLEKNSSM